jgi:hypothetical protein
MNEEDYLKKVAQDLGIQDLPDIDEVHVQWSGRQVWARARLLANHMYDTDLSGQQHGLETAKEILHA